LDHCFLDFSPELAYYHYLDLTGLSASVKTTGCVAMVAGILTQSGGFFLHTIVGQPNQSSIGTTVTIAVLVYGLITTA
jgi:hypothetical protein